MTDYGPEIVRGSAAWPEALEPKDMDRFWSNVSKPSEDACWEWTGHIRRNGYGRFVVERKRKRKQLAAHRVAFEAKKGSAIVGCLDHLCRNRACCNPAHLEEVTNKVNVLRGGGITALNAVKTHCLRGHLFDEENTLIFSDKKGPRRICRKCHLIRGAKFRRARGIPPRHLGLIAEPEPTLLDQYDGPITPEVRAFAAWMKGRE